VGDAALPAAAGSAPERGEPRSSLAGSQGALPLGLRSMNHTPQRRGLDDASGGQGLRAPGPAARMRTWGTGRFLRPQVQRPGEANPVLPLTGFKGATPCGLRSMNHTPRRRGLDDASGGQPHSGFDRAPGPAARMRTWGDETFPAAAGSAPERGESRSSLAGFQGALPLGLRSMNHTPQRRGLDDASGGQPHSGFDRAPGPAARMRTWRTRRFLRPQVRRPSEANPVLPLRGSKGRGPLACGA